MRPHWISGGLLRRIERLSWRGLAYGLISPVFATGLWNRSLKPADSTLKNLSGLPPVDHWPGDANRGATIIDGDFELAGKTLRETLSPWSAPETTPRWRAEVARFDWLEDLRAAGGDVARVRARSLIRAWIDEQGRWRRLTWRPDILGARIGNWIGHADFLLTAAEEEFRQAFFSSLFSQARHLRRVARLTPAGGDRVVVLQGLILAALTLQDDKKLYRWTRWLDTEITRQLLADGGHIERNPSRHLALLRHLIDVRSALKENGRDLSADLVNAIDRMAPMLRFFRHGDGMLSLFNGAIEEEDWLIDVVLERSEARGKPLSSAPHSGYERLTANRTLVLLDAGAPPPAGPDRDAHAGILSFEMSVGKERLVVNCGAHRGDSDQWRAVQRTTAAHSTLSIEDVNAGEILASGGFGNRPGAPDTERREAEGNIWVDASHDGYSPTFGLVHTRRLYLESGGTALRGEDTLSGRGNRKFAVRFHLHPGVSASMIQEGRAVLLRLPSGAGWQFRASGGVLALHESAYLGAGDRIKRTEQIVVSSATSNGDGQIKWMFSQV